MSCHLNNCDLKLNHFPVIEPDGIYGQYHVTEPHGQGGNAGLQQTNSRNGDGNYIINKGPEEISFDGAEGMFAQAQSQWQMLNSFAGRYH